jgi:glycosyltransferase involved in cell wall biosynthesis
LVGAAAGGIPEVIQHGVNGLLCPPGDAEGAASCLLDVLGDADRARAMGEAGRQRYLQAFTLERMLRRIQELYANSMAPTAGAAAGRAKPAGATARMEPD